MSMKNIGNIIFVIMILIMTGLGIKLHLFIPALMLLICGITFIFINKKYL